MSTTQFVVPLIRLHNSSIFQHITPTTQPFFYPPYFNTPTPTNTHQTSAHLVKIVQDSLEREITQTITQSVQKYSKTVAADAVHENKKSYRTPFPGAI